MRIASISTTAHPCHAPAGIMTAISSAAVARGDNALIVYGRGKHPDLPGIEYRRVGSDFGVWMHALASRTLGRQGLASKRAAIQAIDELRLFKPDIVHLHILHGHYMNLPTLVDELAAMSIPVVITMHDMWLLTGRCCFPDSCDRWHRGCGRCRHKQTYPPTVITLSRTSQKIKTSLIESLPNVTLVAPSRWMADRISESKLSGIPLQIIHNGVNKSIFYPETGCRSHSSQFTIIGVANRWEPRKHLEHLVAFIPYLKEDEKLVLVGASGAEVPTSRNVTLLPLTENRPELARIYREADLMVNPSSAESYGMATAEALACGTPVIVPPQGALAELLGKAPEWIVDTSEPRQLREAIDALRKHPRSYNGMVNDETHMAQEYLSLFDNLTK